MRSPWVAASLLVTNSLMRSSVLIIDAGGGWAATGSSVSGCDFAPDLGATVGDWFVDEGGSCFFSPQPESIAIASVPRTVNRITMPRLSVMAAFSYPHKPGINPVDYQAMVPKFKLNTFIRTDFLAAFHPTSTKDKNTNGTLSPIRVLVFRACLTDLQCALSAFLAHFHAEIGSPIRAFQAPQPRTRWPVP